MTRTIQHIIEVGPGVGTSRTPTYPDGAVTDGWREIEWRNFGSRENGTYYGGIWFGGPGTARIDSIPSDQFVCIRKGAARFTDANGDSRHFEEGAAFLMPKGFAGEWEILRETEIVYVALGPFDSNVP
ncbi:cupin domain-containing protein [Streptomyces chartreusis]|uniref:cupin domain-containing protein n=1 Tax=Streptomyces chartreusis TaxID=1969 RepID=UPI003D8E5655